MSIGSGPPLLVAFVALVVFTAWRIGSRRCRPGPETWLATFVWCAFLIMAYAVALSAFRRLAAGGMLLLAATGAAAATALPRATRPPASHEEAAPLTRRQAGLLALALLPPIAFGAFALFLAVRAPETGYDNLSYHQPRVAYWIRQQAVGSFLANDPRIGSFPPNGNVLHLVPALFLRHDRLCGAVQLAAMAATGLGIVALARTSGASRTAAVFAALVWFSVPSVADQASLTMVDVTASAFVTAAVYFLVRRPSTAFHLFTCLLATLLAVGTKQHLLVVAAPIGSLAAVPLLRRHRAAAPAVGLGLVLATLAAGGLFALQNREVWGSAGGLPALRWVVVGPSLGSFVKNLEIVLLPLAWWWPGAPAWAPRFTESVAAAGFGLCWTALTCVSVLLLAWDLAIRRAPEARAWRLPAALGLGAALVLLVLLRHQHAVYRFVLPLVAVLTALHARTFERLADGRSWRRWSLLGLAWLTAAGVLVQQSRWQARARRTGNAWVSATSRYGKDLEPFAADLRRRSLRGSLRVGVITGQYFPHGLFFGRGYRHVVVPLSYDPPATAAAIDALGLDALWVSLGAGCRVDLFRRDFEPPPAQPTTSWSPAVRAFDEDFMRASQATIDMVDVRPTLSALVEPGTRWGGVARRPAGVLFVRGEGQPLGVERLCGERPR